MSSRSQAWEDGMRAEALAKIVLTRRKDLQILTGDPLSKTNDVDFVVRVSSEGKFDNWIFGVEVKGRKRVTESLVFETAKRVERSLQNSIPTCLFVMNTNTEKGWYVWLLRPAPGDQRNIDLISLHNEASGHFTLGDYVHELTDEGVESIVEQVKTWYTRRRILNR